VVFGDIELQAKILEQMNEVPWRPVTILTDAAVYIGREQLKTPAKAISVARRLIHADMGMEERADWERFRDHDLSKDDRSSEAALDGYLQVRALVTLLEICSQDASPTCLKNNYARSSTRWVAQTVIFNGETWTSIGAEGPAFSP
jgi:hypothetical protein